MFFHDVTNPGYPNLLNYQKRAEELGKPFYLFNSDSRSDERCWRGLLMIVNKKQENEMQDFFIRYINGDRSLGSRYGTMRMAISMLNHDKDQYHMSTHDHQTY